MKDNYKRSIGQLNKSFYLTLPKDIMVREGWNRGDEIMLKQTDEGLLLKKFDDKKTIYTIGYEGLSPANFLGILLDNEVEQLIDVREIALSRKNGFSKGLMKKTLEEADIRYHHYSKLGSPKNIRQEYKEGGSDKEFFKKYKKYLEEDSEAMKIIKDLEGLATIRKTAIMCFERDWKTCHRKIIAEILEKNGWTMVHLNEPIFTQRKIYA